MLTDFKSRFIEMFGNPINNEMQWPTEKMKEVAPSVQADNKPLVDGNWLLNLDAIQSNTGDILFKNKVSDLELNGSIIAFSSNHVLYSKLRPYLNKVVLPDESGYGTTELIPLLPDMEKITRTYLAHLLRSDAFVSKFSSAVAGTKMPRVSMDVFWKFEVPIPPIELQHEYGKFVEQVDKSKVIKESIKSRFNELFGTYCPTHKLKEACTLISRGKSASYVEKSDYYIIGQACIRLDRIEFDRVRCMNPSKYDEGYVLKNGDILVNSTGVGSLGRCNTFYNPDNRVYFTDSHVTILRLNLEIIDPTFLKYYLNQNNIQSELYSKCVNGSTNQIELNKAAFTVFPIPIPPIDVQKKFSNYVKQVDKSKVGILSTILLINNYTITGLWYDG